MAWRRPSCVARAFRSTQNSFQWESHLSRPSFIAPRKQCLSIVAPAMFLRSQKRSQKHSQKRSLSTSAEEPEIKAAPPIDTAKLKITPSRILPTSPAYFTGTPKFIDDVLKLEYIQSKYALLRTVPASEAPRTAFLKHADYKNVINEEVPAAKYRQLQKILFRLNQIQPDLVPKEVKDVLKNFIRPGNPYQQQLKPKELDNKGRARGVGRRKTSHARVWLVEGEGEVLINGKNIVQVFSRLHDRESALWPLKVTNRLDKYNVFAIVRGGGVTGQAEAMTVALGKALLVHEPAIKPILRRAGCISTDPRQVERKKPGHLKARKMPAWVRR
ncbi:hypothetical protein PABG_06893 [Paracoccidioides brasiliensis Pb03]|nr:hypothetical protein PABG_06893 [Paracoccidioides brasiliensis Pb03]